MATPTSTDPMREPTTVQPLFHDPNLVIFTYNSGYDATLTIAGEPPLIHQSWLFLGRLVFRRDTPRVF